MNATTRQTAAAPLWVCVLTGRKMAAIASVALSGRGAKAALEGFLGDSAPELGAVRYGKIKDEDGHILDSVVIGCEGQDCYMVHCHGNPLIAERIVRLFERAGAVMGSSQVFLMNKFKAESKTLMEAELRLAMVQSATLAGVQWLVRQREGGISAWACVKSFELNELKEQSQNILRDSLAAEKVISGVRIALVGAPNSGKSTLLNRLAGERAALVSDTAGTTRDWVSTICRIGPLRAEIIDTAGLDSGLAVNNMIERAAQEAAVQTAAGCDLILNIRDCTCPMSEKLTLPQGVPVLEVFTKSDLLATPASFETGGGVLVSALAERGIEELSAAILRVLDVDALDYDRPIAFTDRQRELLTKLADCGTEAEAGNLLSELCGQGGQLCF